jgi:hypothetical protein
MTAVLWSETVEMLRAQTWSSSRDNGDRQAGASEFDSGVEAGKANGGRLVVVGKRKRVRDTRRRRARGLCLSTHGGDV